MSGKFEDNPLTNQNQNHQNTNDDTYRTTRPPITKAESVVLAEKLFSLQVSEDALSEVKELPSYKDRNFLIKGKLSQDSRDSNEERYFVLKVLDTLTSKNRDLFKLLSDLLPFISSQAIFECPVPQMSIYGTRTVLCRINKHQNDQDTSCIDKRELPAGIKVVLSEDDTIDDVCAVLLLRFIDGQVLCDVELTKELLVDCGKNMAHLHRILKEYSVSHSWLVNAQLQILDWPWANDGVTLAVNKHSFAVNNNTRRAHVKHISQRFQTEVLDQLESFDRQLIHGDVSEQNVIVRPNPNNGKNEIKGIIDFINMQYSYRVLDVGATIGYLMLEAFKMNFDVIEACNHLIEGYQSEFPLTDSEIDKLFIAAKGRICQSVVMGAYVYQMNPDNEYPLYTQERGWKVLEYLQSVTDSEVITRWKQF